MQRSTAVGQLKEIYRLLDRDCEEACNYGLKHQSPYALRSFIRAFFAMVEGVTYQLRLIAFVTLKDTPLLNKDDHEKLAEIAQGLGLQPPHIKVKHFGLIKALPHSMQVYAKCHGAKFKLDCSGRGWHAMRQAIKVRDRLMHPKAIASLEISSEEDRQIAIALEWWRASLAEMLRVCESGDEYWRSQIETGQHLPQVLSEDDLLSP